MLAAMAVFYCHTDKHRGEHGEYISLNEAHQHIERQHEAVGDIRSSMIVIAALVEGVALFAVIVSALALFL